MNNKHDHPESTLLKMGRQAGIGMHVTSLPGDCGIGDIADSARWFIDRLAEMNIGVWQFLPLGPTAYGDSPYQPLSAFAGNANLVGLEPLYRAGLLDLDDLEPLRHLPAAYTDYGRLIAMKRRVLGKAAERFMASRGNGLVEEFEQFLHEEGEKWLDDYSLFRALKTFHGERPWPEWEKAYVHRQPDALQRARDDHRKSIEYTQIFQFLFDRQWRALKRYAGEKGVCLFGDIPIYVALDSSDAWAHPEILQIDRDGRPSHVAGVPPDYFSEDGQLWGNPLYDWDYHAATNYAWWTDRMRHQDRQTHLVRIDHFRGFESYWSVPSDENTARNGEWIPGPGEALFEAMRESLGPLPIVAEDLGVITPEVEALRLDQGFPGMVVLQFEVGDPDFEFEKIAENSACYTGTHDNDTTTGWFQGTGDDTRSEKEIAETRTLTLERTRGTAETIHSDMIRLAFSSNSSLAVAPMQDFLGLGSQARLNIPGTTMNNWRWRLDRGQLDGELIESVAVMVEESSRGGPVRLDSHS